MKKIINNKRYDTYSSWSIGESVRRSKKDPTIFIRDELFVKITGEFFILSESNLGKKETRIIPIDEQIADLWMRNHLGVYAVKYMKGS